MIRLLKRSEINSDSWDKCIENSVDGQIFGFSWYLDICCPGWCALVKNDYEYVFPLYIKNKFGIKYLIQPFFTRHFGIYSKHEISCDILVCFLKSIPEDIRFWEFCIKESCEAKIKGLRQISKKYQALLLNEPYLEIRKHYSENLLRNLKKSEKEAYKIYHEYSPEFIAEQFRFLQKDKIKAFEENDFKTLSSLMVAVKSHSKYRSIGVINANNNVVAGGFFMESHNRIVYLKGFSTIEGKKNGAMHYLFDQLILENAAHDKVLDFGGSNIESVARFYKNFGARDFLYLQLYKNRLPLILRLIKNIHK